MKRFAHPHTCTQEHTHTRAGARVCVCVFVCVSSRVCLRVCERYLFPDWWMLVFSALETIWHFRLVQRCLCHVYARMCLWNQSLPKTKDESLFSETLTLIFPLSDERERPLASKVTLIQVYGTSTNSCFRPSKLFSIPFLVDSARKVN